MSLHSSSDEPSVSWTVSRSGSFSVEMPKTTGSDPVPMWQGQTNANGPLSLQDHLVVRQQGMEAFNVSAIIRAPDTSKPNAAATLIIDPANKIYRVDFALGYFVTVTLNGFSQPGVCGNPGIRPLLKSFPLPESGLVLSGSLSYPAGDACNLTTFDCNDCILGYAVIGGAKNIPGTVEITWTLRPKPEPELLIEPQGYSTWRPEAGRDETTPGNSIPIKVTLRNKDGTPAEVKASQLIFELIDTSREPGVAMNFPLKAKAKNTFDLQFRPADNPGTLTIKNNGQNAETSSGEYTTYTVMLISFDWGGWTKFRATAVLPEDQKVVGHLAEDTSVEEVPLPKRKDESHIAEAWVEKSGAIGKDDKDDTENEPAGDGNEGDGLTLYEEYRGFYEKGRHIEGNPKKKDYFLLNLVGGDAEAGVRLFARLSNLEVHKDLKRDEIADDRLINANYDQAAHSVDQHGVIIKTARVRGAFGSGDLPPGTPKNTPLVLIEPRDDPFGTFGGTATVEYRIFKADALKAYDRAVAHELFHTVGVWHHGEGDYKLIWRWTHSSKSADGKPYIASLQQNEGHLTPGGTAMKIRVTLEETGRDYAQVLEERMSPVFESYPNLNPTRTILIDPVIVGKAGGQHSGADDCVMRYYFATAYEVKGSPNEFYVFEHQDIGLQLDDSTEGTGNNAPSHKPQPRFFNASVSKGDRHQIVVNDKANPSRP